MQKRARHPRPPVLAADDHCNGMSPSQLSTGCDVCTVGTDRMRTCRQGWSTAWLMNAGLAGTPTASGLPLLSHVAVYAVEGDAVKGASAGGTVVDRVRPSAHLHQSGPSQCQAGPKVAQSRACGRRAAVGPFACLRRRSSAVTYLRSARGKLQIKRV